MVKGSVVLLDDDFPHGTVDGYDRGCKGGHCPAAIACRDVKRRYGSDLVFRRMFDAGMTLGEILEADREAAERDALVETNRKRTEKGRPPLTVAMADSDAARSATTAARRPKPSPPTVRPSDLVRPVPDVDEESAVVAPEVGMLAELIQAESAAPEPVPASRPRKWAVRKVWMAIAPDGSAHGPFEGQQEGLTFVSAQFPAPPTTSTVPASDAEDGRRVRRQWTDADSERARTLWGRGMTDSAIARAMEKDRGALGRRLRGMGLAPNQDTATARPEKPKAERKPREVQGHGTNASYARGCRCAECKDAARAYHREYVARRRSEGVPAKRHGTAYGYGLGCQDRETCPATPTCVDVVLELDIARRRAKGVPEQAPRVPADESREHVRALMQAGMSLDAIAKAAEVSRSTLGTLLYGRSGDRKGQLPEEIKAESARRLLALDVSKTPVA